MSGAVFEERFIKLVEDNGGIWEDVYVKGSGQLKRRKPCPQAYLIDNYNVRAIYRGMNAKMFSGNKNVKYAEAFQRFRPYVGKEFH